MTPNFLSATFVNVAPILGWTLAHFLWQGALVAAILSLLLRTLPSARARHDLALGGLIFMALLPIATFAWLKADVRILLVPAGVPGLEPGQSFTWEKIAVGVWLAGVALLAIRATGGLILIERIRRAATPLPPEWVERCRTMRLRVTGSLSVVFAQSDAIATPLVAGWLKPMVLIPTAALARLPVDQLEALILHELAHVRRLDAFANLVQTIVETALFYHPAVWWVSRQVRVEREHCCDDVAVSAVGSPTLYVRALQAIEGLRSPPFGVLAAAGGDLKSRAARILGLAAGPAQPALSRTAAVLILTAAAAAMTHSATVEASPTPKPPTTASAPVAETPATREVQAATPAPAPIAAAPRIVLAEAAPTVAEVPVLAGTAPAEAAPPPNPVAPPIRLAPANAISPVIVTSPGPTPTPDLKIKMFGSGAADPDFVLWPTKAFEKGREGRALLRCEIDTHGLAERCQVISESPAGLNFGKTALALRPTFKLPPTVGADGPIAATKTIAVVFRTPVSGGVDDPQTGGSASMDVGGGNQAGSAGRRSNTGVINDSRAFLSERKLNILENPVWAQAATFDDLARAYPAKGGGEEGYAVASCHVKRAGDLEACTIIKEAPERRGFDRAALGLAARFKIAPQSFTISARRDLIVNIAIRMPPPAALAERTVMAPQWILGVDSRTTPKIFPPEAAAQGLTTGRGVALCKVAVGGALTACAPDPEASDGLGFSEAAAKLASGMKMNLWSADAAPVEGGVVHIPIRLNLKPAG